MCAVVDGFNSPGYRISGDVKQSSVVEPFHRSTKLFRLSWLNLHFALLDIQRQAIGRIASEAYLSHRMPSPRIINFPLLIIRCVNHRWKIQTYETTSIREIFGGTTTDFLRVLVDVEVSHSMKILDLVNSWPNSSVSEDGRTVR